VKARALRLLALAEEWWSGRTRWRQSSAMAVATLRWFAAHMGENGGGARWL